MRLYHRKIVPKPLKEWHAYKGKIADSLGMLFRSALIINKPRNTFVLFLAALLFTACVAPHVTQGDITVHIIADGSNLTVEVPAGSTVSEALSAARIDLGNLDRTEPPIYTVLDQGSTVKLIRVHEEFTVEQVVVPFETQVMRNESLAEGQEYWLQLGENGLQEITIRHVYEDGVEVSSNQVNVVTIKEPRPQIKMIGVQKPFAPITIPGRLAYLQDGNAWVMESTTGIRRQVVTTGDLDGRIFSLSSDGSWLLFTRRGTDENTINTLWAASLDGDPDTLIDLKIANIVHFAEWKPGSKLTFAFSTVEPRSSAPGWQANNDLILQSFSVNGFLNPQHAYLDANQGGLYGWWGTQFDFAPDGLHLAYAQPDSFGVFNLETGFLSPLLEIAPLQTYGDWAWVPNIAWGPDGATLYATTHGSPVDSQQFDLVAIPMADRIPLPLVHDVGMFAYPTPSPIQNLFSGENAYQVAYLQALFPAQGERSPYQLVVMDRDGSNRRNLFPEEGAGLDPQKVVWSPKPLEGRGGYVIAVLYQKNLWLVDADTGESFQITGDGLTSYIDWK
jgi:hypothetical protein